MYHLKKSIESTENASLQDCFGAQVKYWFWIMLIFVTGTIIFAIMSLKRPGPVYPSVAVSVPQGGQLQPIAWTRQCPNCLVGVLDAQGQCNLASCQLYGSRWRGQMPAGQNAAFTPCPRCAGGQLDVYGRCNQRGCVLSGGTGAQGGAPHPGAWTGRCPNCVQGMLDAQGRCNVANCPLYRPGRGGQASMGQTVALTPCPRCNGGQLDIYGRCNQKGCVLYGVTGTLGNKIPVKLLLIKELAMTIGATQGKNTVIVLSVYGNGNADKAGLKVGDRITRFNGRKITSVKQFQATVARAVPEATVKIEVFRLEKKQSLKVFVGEGEMEGAVIPPAK